MIRSPTLPACFPVSRRFQPGVCSLPSQRCRLAAPSRPWYTREQWHSLRAYLARPTPEFWVSPTRFLDELDEVFVIVD